MKTIILKLGLWALMATVFSSLFILLNLNVVNRVDELINRQEFEAFLNQKISEFILQKDVPATPAQLPVTPLSGGMGIVSQLLPLS